jgi:hypothetical protein
MPRASSGAALATRVAVLDVIDLRPFEVLAGLLIREYANPVLPVQSQYTLPNAFRTVMAK